MNQAAKPPSRETVAKKAPDKPLDLGQLLDELVADGLVRADLARGLRQRPPERKHPLVRIAECEWDNPQQPGKRLTLETLVQWLAARSGLPYLRIDPLSIDVARVTTVVSYAYAARVKILPVKVT